MYVVFYNRYSNDESKHVSMGEMIGYHKNAFEIIIITTNTKIEISMGIYEEFGQ